VAAKGFQPFDGFGIPPENGEAASIDLRSIFGTLLRHWKLVSIVPLLALIGTYVIFMFVPQQFKSTTESSRRTSSPSSSRRVALPWNGLRVG
jgi:uncharacterized protein involved in exopolysaccharide biosynthesis